MPNNQDSTESSEEKSNGEITEDEIELNLVETFPASDPPSWTLGHEPHGKYTTHSEDDSSDETDSADEGEDKWSK